MGQKCQTLGGKVIERVVPFPTFNMHRRRAFNRQVDTVITRARNFIRIRIDPIITGQSSPYQRQRRYDIIISGGSEQVLFLIRSFEGVNKSRFPVAQRRTITMRRCPPGGTELCWKEVLRPQQAAGHFPRLPRSTSLSSVASIESSPDPAKTVSVPKRGINWSGPEYPMMRSSASVPRRKSAFRSRPWISFAAVEQPRWEFPGSVVLPSGAGLIRILTGGLRSGCDGRGRAKTGPGAAVPSNEILRLASERSNLRQNRQAVFGISRRRTNPLARFPANTLPLLTCHCGKGVGIR